MMKMVCLMYQKVDFVLLGPVPVVIGVLHEVKMDQHVLFARNH